MSSPIRIALIATYPEISTMFYEITSKMEGVVAHNVHASFDEAVAAAKRIENETDVILSRGGTGEFIRRSVDIPVVLIPITPFDIVLAMQKFDPSVYEFGLSRFNNPIYGIEEIENIYGVTIHDCVFENLKELEDNVVELKRKGIKNILGGEVAVRCARENGIFGVDLSAGLDTVNRAISEGISIVVEARKEKSRTARLAAAFDAITSGLILTDNKNEVLICNPVADKLLNHQCVVGKEFDDSNDPRMREAIRTQTAKLNYIRRLNDTLINTSHLPVILDNSFIGFVHTFDDVTKIQTLEQTIRKQIHEKGFVAKYHFDDITTCDPTMIALKHNAESYAKSRSSVHIEGESGTGKELFAQSLHNASPRAGMPFVAVNCAAIPASLLESELFGYEAGAFTGARKDGRQGLFEIAHNGTIFLDEIGDLPMEFQARLLRVLQEKEFMRVGGSRVIPVDVRVISATNKNLRELCLQGKFREDLFYRLSVFNINIPPLRQRPCDIVPLCQGFLKDMGVSMDRGELAQILPQLVGHCWPGNVRELHNIAERLAHILRTTGCISPERLDMVLGLPSTGEQGGFSVHIDLARHKDLKGIVEEVEWQVIDYMLKLHDKKFMPVAERLSIGRTTLWRKYNRTH
jgi:transcriptional regulator with PAS, ATPase and Fis domain